MSKDLGIVGDLNVEEAGRDALLGGEEPVVDLATPVQESPAPAQLGFGYTVLDTGSKLPSKGLFSPKSYVSSIRSLNVEEMKYYAEMNESSILDIDEKINFILNRGIKVQVHGKAGSYKDISVIDKIFYIFALRDITMKTQQREVKLTQAVTNPKTGAVVEVEINNDSFDYHSIDVDVMQFYDEQERGFVFEHPDFTAPIKLYVPTVGVTEYIGEYVRRQAEKKEKGEGFINENFIKTVQFMIKDWRDLDPDDKYITRLYEQYQSFTYDEHMLITEVKEKINLGIKNTILVNFGEGESALQVRVPINFRGGYKGLFNLSNIFDKLKQSRSVHSTPNPA